MSRAVPLKRLLILLTALGLLPIAIIGAWGISLALGEQQREAQRSMLGLSRALSSAVVAELDATISSLGTLSRSASLTRGDFESFYVTARETVKANPDWGSVILTDAQSKVIFKTALPFGASDGRVVEPESLAQAMATGEATVGLLTRGQVMAPAIPVRMPVLVDGRVAYVITAAIKPDRMLGLLTRQQAPPSWVVSIHDAANTRVARSRDHSATVAKGISPSLAALLSSGKPEGIGTARTLDDEEVLTAFARTPRYGWTVVVGAPTREIKSVLARSYGLHAVGLGLSLALCIGLALLISRRIVRAMESLQREARRLGSGQSVETVEAPIIEINQVGHELALASQQQRAAGEERELLMASLNTALRSLREALLNAEKAGQAKDNFLAVLGHELRNPLAPIHSGAELLGTLYASDPRVKDIAAIIGRQASHMARIVDDLLDVSRLVRGMVKLDRKPLDLRQVVQFAADQVQPAVDEKKQQLLITLPEEPVLVDADETRLGQAIANVFSNATRYTGPGGRIEARLETASGAAWLSVKDNGSGIAPDLLPHVFELFTQGKRDMARSEGGLGIGLALVKKLVEFHDGTVEAHSEGPGRGSQFVILLPLSGDAGSDDAITRTKRAERPGGPPAAILVVDDNEDAAAVLASLLEMDGHQVSLAKTGGEALIQARTGMIDVVILDIGLPDIDGYTVASRLREDPGTRDCYIIALTGYGQPLDRVHSEAAGIDVHLAKPAGMDILRKLIAHRPAAWAFSLPQEPG
ncbi:MAG: hybrid sensor histidine kinase/response regulator [Paucimonas sp.]|nr:hybrid sensor histidine kinase/response regulator [Paucimonas sp.]